MSLQRFAGSFRQIDEDTSGGILCSEGVKRDDAEWLVDGITWNDELPLNVEHIPPPVGVFVRIGRVMVNGVAALAGVWKWGPQEVPRVAETRALVKSGIYTALSSGIIPLDRELQNGVVTITKADLLEVSVVSVPADPLAKITQRSLDSYSMGRLFRSLPRVPNYAVERVMERIHQPSSALRPSVGRFAQAAGLAPPPPNPFLSPDQQREVERQWHHAVMGSAHVEQERLEQDDRRRRVAEMRARLKANGL